MEVVGNTKTLVIQMKTREHDEINKVRRFEGLQPIEPAVVKCLRCDTEFDSWDKRNNRICDICKSDEDYNSECEAYNLSPRFLKRLPRSKTWLDRRVSFLDAHYGDGYDEDSIIEESLLDTTLMDREDL